MSSAAQELISIVDGLPEDKAREVVDFARFLQQQSGEVVMTPELERLLDEGLDNLDQSQTTEALRRRP